MKLLFTLYGILLSLINICKYLFSFRIAFDTSYFLSIFLLFEVHCMVAFQSGSLCLGTFINSDRRFFSAHPLKMVKCISYASWRWDAIIP